ncbi:ABC transporter permease [Herbiconiux sp. CPCC 203407]|uniref:ABC transporter permease n=1 Tax=Herbiconiux oxytropis TaxID=2970915 RepID=A0AA41XEN6_9MICO|nr:ABC transporter permease [Herbiconiux oxytropis]MCS5720620.1 ABC transporter permease [Herbiconiux oxytropis]MCS5725053.1 ABC transporter permease [Herbiconiux oxytropis]
MPVDTTDRSTTQGKNPMSATSFTTSTDMTGSEQRSGLSRFTGLLGRGDGDVARVLILLLLVVVLGLIAPAFFSKASWIATSQYSTQIVLLAIGQAFVIITGGIDLSVGAVLGCSAMISAVSMRSMLGTGMDETLIVVVGFAIGVGSAAVMGLVNGLVITKMKITPFIATLGMLGVATGGTNLISGGSEIVELPAQLNTVGNATVFGGWLTIPVLVTIVAAVVAGLVLSRTRFGMRTYAIGSNAAAARRAGIGVDRQLIKVYVLSGVMAGIAGVLLMSRFVDASPLAGADAELASIAAAVIGGASLTGGRGSILGAVIGAAITATLQTGLILAGVASFWQTVAVGVIIVLAVFGDQLRITFSRA